MATDEIDTWFAAFAQRVAATAWDAAAGPAAVIFAIDGCPTTFALDATRAPPAVIRVSAKHTFGQGIQGMDGIRVCRLMYSSPKVFLGIVHKRRSLQSSWMFGDAGLKGDK